MPTFSYEAIDSTGEEVRGSIEAGSKDEGLRIIRDKGLSPFSIKRESASSKRASFSLISPSKSDNLILFTGQLANLLRANVQLGDALQVINNLIKDEEFKDIVSQISNSLEGGQGFAESLGRYPNYFSSSYINMVKAGEEGGFLALTCERLAQDLDNSNKFKSFIVSSLIYPFILLIVSFVAIIVMLTYVLPRFISIYDSYGGRMPWMTELLLRISQSVSQYWIWASLVVVFGLILFILYYKSEGGRRKIDSLLLKVPLLGNLIVTISITKLSRSMGSMLEGGVPLLKSIAVSKHIVNNSILSDALTEVNLKVERGSYLSDALDKVEIFPEIFFYMVGVGEKTGELSSVLLDLADNFEEDSRANLEKLMNLFEPLTILIMGCVIGFIVISTLLPLLEINVISF